LHISRSKSCFLEHLNIASLHDVELAILNITKSAILYAVKLVYLKLDSLNVPSMMHYLLNFLSSKLHDDKNLILCFSCNELNPYNKHLIVVLLFPVDDKGGEVC